MARRRKKPFISSETSSSGWIVTFSDLMTLLLTFFILLYSISTVSEAKFRQAAASLQSVLSGNPTTVIFEDPAAGAETMPFDPMHQQPLSNVSNAVAMDMKIRDMYEKIQKFIEDNQLNAEIDVTYNAKGVLVNISEAVLFESGSAVIKTEGQLLLDTMSRLLNTMDNEVEVQGHTDNKPIRTEKYPTNWELSVDRAVQVTRYFIQHHQIEPQRLKAAGFAEFQPLVPNDTPEHMAQNRRVNLLIILDQELGGTYGGTT